MSSYHHHAVHQTLILHNYNISDTSVWMQRLFMVYCKAYVYFWQETILAQLKEPSYIFEVINPTMNLCWSAPNCVYQARNIVVNFSTAPTKHWCIFISKSFVMVNS